MCISNIRQLEQFFNGNQLQSLSKTFTGYDQKSKYQRAKNIKEWGKIQLKTIIEFLSEHHNFISNKIQMLQQSLASSSRYCREHIFIPKSNNHRAHLIFATLPIPEMLVYKPSFVRLQCLLLALYRILFPVFIRTHCGTGLFMFILCASLRLMMNVL